MSDRPAPPLNPFAVLAVVALGLVGLVLIAVMSGCHHPPPVHRDPVRVEDVTPVPPNSGLFLPPGSH